MAEPGGSSYMRAMHRFQNAQGNSKNNNKKNKNKNKKGGSKCGCRTRRKGGFFGRFKKKVNTKKNNKNYNNMNLSALESQHKKLSSEKPSFSVQDIIWAKTLAASLQIFRTSLENSNPRVENPIRSFP